jgi:hypothetical protein
MRKVAVPCGIIGGVWALLAPLLVFLPVYKVGVTAPFAGGVGGEKMVSMVEAGVVGDALPILSYISLMGILGLLALVLVKRKPRLGKIFLWVSALAILAVSVLSIFSIGLLFLPASALLLVAAFGLRRESKREAATKASKR